MVILQDENENMLSFKNFNKFYNNICILEIENLFLGEGVYWVKGINGSGKSTLLKSVAGIISFKGEILLNEKISINKHPVAYRRLVNFAEAEPIFPDFLRGRDLIQLFLASKKAVKNQENSLLENMQMSGYIDQPIRTYSSGMLKKLSLVLAFLGKPDLILLDEPLITLDKKSVETLYQWISESHKKTGVNFLITSHQPLEAGILSYTQTIQVTERKLTN